VQLCLSFAQLDAARRRPAAPPAVAQEHGAWGWGALLQEHACADGSDLAAYLQVADFFTGEQAKPGAPAAAADAGAPGKAAAARADAGAGAPAAPHFDIAAFGGLSAWRPAAGAGGGAGEGGGGGAPAWAAAAAAFNGTFKATRARRPVRVVRRAAPPPPAAAGPAAPLAPLPAVGAAGADARAASPAPDAVAATREAADGSNPQRSRKKRAAPSLGGDVPGLAFGVPVGGDAPAATPPRAQPAPPPLRAGARCACGYAGACKTARRAPAAGCGRSSGSSADSSDSESSGAGSWPRGRAAPVGAPVQPCAAGGGAGWRRRQLRLRPRAPAAPPAAAPPPPALGSAAAAAAASAGATALHAAAGGGHAAIVERLLEGGADADAQVRPPGLPRAAVCCGGGFAALSDAKHPCSWALTRRARAARAGAEWRDRAAPRGQLRARGHRGEAAGGGRRRGHPEQRRQHRAAPGRRQGCGPRRARPARCAGQGRAWRPWQRCGRHCRSRRPRRITSGPRHDGAGRGPRSGGWLG